MLSEKSIAVANPLMPVFTMGDPENPTRTLPFDQQVNRMDLTTLGHFAKGYDE